jgi:hypothetical protein
VWVMWAWGDGVEHGERWGCASRGILARRLLCDHQPAGRTPGGGPASDDLFVSGQAAGRLGPPGELCALAQCIYLGAARVWNSPRLRVPGCGEINTLQARQRVKGGQDRC